jgi:heat shock protein HslJ
MLTGTGTLLAACAPPSADQSAAAAEAADLAGRRWIVQSVTPSAEPDYPWADRGVDITFEVEPGRAAGFAGCNHWSASYTVQQGGVMRFHGAVATFMACIDPPDLMTREREFLDALEKVEAYRIRGDRLELSGAEDSRITLRAAGA